MDTFEKKVIVAESDRNAMFSNRSLKIRTPSKILREQENPRTSPKNKNLENNLLNEEIAKKIYSDGINKDSPYRWFILLQIGMINFFLMGIGLYIVPVSASIQYAYDVTSYQFNGYASPMDFLLFFMLFLNLYIAAKFGVKANLLLGTCQIAIGCAVNLLMGYSFYFIYIGQPLTSLGICLISPVTPEICDRWFRPKDRPFALAISLILKDITGIFNLLIPLLFIHNNTEGPKEIITQGKQRFDQFRVCLSLFFFFVILILFKERPKVQGNDENAERQIENDNIVANTATKKFDTKVFFNVVRKLFGDKGYVCLCIGVSFGVGYITILIQWVPQIYNVFGYDQNTVSLGLAAGLILAIPCALIYTKCCIQYPDQILRIERMLVLNIICNVSLFFMIYFNINIYITFAPLIMIICLFFLGVVVIMEEVIKYCSFIVPGCTLYATTLAAFGQILVELLINSFTGKLLDSPLRETHLLAGLIITLMQLIFVIFQSLAEYYMSMHKNYGKVKSMRNIINGLYNGSERKVSYKKISHEEIIEENYDTGESNEGQNIKKDLFGVK